MVRLPAASARSALVLVLELVPVLAAATPAALAQYSPNCERNGRRDFCAYTPGPDPAGAALDAGRLVFADHRVYGLQRDERSCRERGPVRTCRAWILAPGSDRPIPATYRGTAYEGGYRHEYISAKLRLSYSFLD